MTKQRASEIVEQIMGQGSPVGMSDEQIDEYCADLDNMFPGEEIDRLRFCCCAIDRLSAGVSNDSKPTAAKMFSSASAGVSGAADV